MVIALLASSLPWLLIAILTGLPHAQLMAYVLCIVGFLVEATTVQGDS